MLRVGLSHDPLRFYLSFYDVSKETIKETKEALFEEVLLCLLRLRGSKI